MISFIVSVDAVLIRIVVDSSMFGLDGILLTMLFSFVISGAALYYVYLRDKKYAHALVAVSYTHLTLPTNREV